MRVRARDRAPEPGLRRTLVETANAGPGRLGPGDGEGAAGQAAPVDRRRDRAHLRAVARLAPPADRRDLGRADRGTVRGARRDRHAPGAGLERFFTTGIDEETHPAIGDLPRGRGILGVLIREARPLRLHDIADDPRSVGFPREPPADADVPRRPDRAAGRRVREPLPDREGRRADFTVEDEELTQLLAAQAAVAIENARLYESSTRWLRQLETLNEIGDGARLRGRARAAARRSSPGACRSSSRPGSC